MDSNKKWSILTLCITGGLLVCLAAFTAVIDPYFHYHKPLKSLAYPLNNERYQNDGILKHFDYDTIITGSSMAANFKTTDYERIFHTDAVKTVLHGATFREIGEMLSRAMKANDGIERVIWPLDYNRLLWEKDKMFQKEEEYPYYLYDNYLYNDVYYLLNKEVLKDASIGVLKYTKEGNKTTTFDEYGNWTQRYPQGKTYVDGSYKRWNRLDTVETMTQEDYEVLKENLEQNVLSVVRENPDVDFYLFFPPYSIYYWDSLHQEGLLEKQLTIEKAAIEQLLGYDNLHLFSFYNNTDLICNLDNYCDMLHYGEDINTQILQWMAEGEYLITEENYEEYCDFNREFYTGYDYDALFQ